MADRIFIMHNGILQQTGAPMDVYRQPANRFVAGFIGSPAMNFLEAKVIVADGAMFIDAGGFRVSAPDEFRARLEPYIDRSVIFGVRPEDISLHKALIGTGKGNIVTAHADVVETLGSEIFIYLTCQNQSIVARMEAPDSPPSVGQALEVEFKMVKTHVFDTNTSLTIV